MTESSTTVFVVDPDSISRNAVCRLVTKMKLNYEAYESGRAFLDACHWKRPGCLVTEIRVPDVGGLQIEQELRRLAVPLPVIFVSGHATVDVVVRAMKAGAIHFLAKPPDEQELWDTIQDAIRIDGHRRKVFAWADNLKRQLSTLAAEEREMLHLLAVHESIRDIATELHVSVRTAELRRTRLMRKLHFDSPGKLLRFAFTVAGFDGVPCCGSTESISEACWYRRMTGQAKRAIQGLPELISD